MIGDQIKRWKIVERIGSGSFADVYRGEPVDFGARVAIKVLRQKAPKSPENVERFFNEARIVSVLEDPGVVQIYDHGYHDDYPYLVMESVPGESLDQVLARGPLRWPVAAAYCRQLARTLSASHGAGAIHRDVKPQNVLVVPDEETRSGARLKLIDFGVAKLVGELARLSPGTLGATAGTSEYLSPEQCRAIIGPSTADPEIGPGTDIYSLGCLLFRMIAGTAPYPANADQPVFHAHVHAPIPSLRGRVTDVPEALDALTRRMLAKTTQERPATMTAIVSELDRILAAPGNAERRPAPAVPPPVPVAPPPIPVPQPPRPAPVVPAARIPATQQISWERGRDEVVAAAWVAQRRRSRLAVLLPVTIVVAAGFLLAIGYGVRAKFPTGKIVDDERPLADNVTSETDGDPGDPSSVKFPPRASRGQIVTALAHGAPTGSDETSFVAWPALFDDAGAPRVDAAAKWSSAKSWGLDGKKLFVLDGASPVAAANAAYKASGAVAVIVCPRDWDAPPKYPDLAQHPVWIASPDVCTANLTGNTVVTCQHGKCRVQKDMH